MLKLTEELREKCSRPFGRLYSGNDVEITNIEEIQDYSLLICVGDVVSYHALNSGLRPHIILMDKKTKREFNEEISDKVDRLSRDYEVVDVENPIGCVSADLAQKIESSLSRVNSGQKIKMVVEGEEDLAVIPLVCILPQNSLIIYGQPHQGVVALKVTPDKKILIHHILRKMEKVNGNGNEVMTICGVKDAEI
ncbi:MAG: GTP-dependent dephospho-CoA kinase family protein [Archaeoglobaceae archaeon]